MPSYSKNEIVLVRYPFSNLSGSKVRPAIVVNASHTSQDVINLDVNKTADAWSSLDGTVFVPHTEEEYMIKLRS